jgi:hypothetical protein
LRRKDAVEIATAADHGGIGDIAGEVRNAARYDPIQPIRTALDGGRLFSEFQ